MTLSLQFLRRNFCQSQGLLPLAFAITTYHSTLIEPGIRGQFLLQIFHLHLLPAHAGAAKYSSHGLEGSGCDYASESPE